MTNMELTRTEVYLIRALRTLDAKSKRFICRLCTGLALTGLQPTPTQQTQE